MVPIEDIPRLVQEGKMDTPAAEELERKYDQFRHEFTVVYRKTLTLSRELASDMSYLEQEGASVLVLEGQVPVHGYLRMLMRNAGRLLSAHTEEEGLEAARKERPDLILVDLETPEAGGLGLLRRLKSLPETRGIPAVAVSSGGSGAEKDDCQGFGIEGFVSKPIDPVAFRLEIGRVLSGRKENETPPPSLSARGS